MREVFVTVGTRASGKTSFCEKVVLLDPSIIEISRDKILIELFGTTHLDSYSGGHSSAYERMWEIVEKELESQEIKIILDVWNESSRDRRHIVKKLRGFRADRVIAWYFITPVEIVEEWFWKKPGIAKISEMDYKQGEELVFYSEYAPRHDHEFFNRFAKDIDSDGFDEVIRINPVLTNPIEVLRS